METQQANSNLLTSQTQIMPKKEVSKAHQDFTQNLIDERVQKMLSSIQSFFELNGVSQITSIINTLLSNHISKEMKNEERDDAQMCETIHQSTQVISLVVSLYEDCEAIDVLKRLK